MRTVWWPAVKEASKKHPVYAKYAGQRRRYVSSKMGSDSSYTYVYMYFGDVEVARAKRRWQPSLAASWAIQGTERLVRAGITLVCRADISWDPG